MVPTYSLVGPFRGHMSLKSSPFSPGSSCKLSTQYIIQDHMAAHFKKLMSPKAAVDSSAPKSLHTSVKYKDQQKRDRLIQALEKYKKGLVHHLPSSTFKPRSISPSQQKTNWALLENGHPLSGQSNYSRTKREQPPSASHQEFTSRTLMPVPAARKTIPNTAPCALSQTPVHSPSAHRSSASPLLQPHMPLGSHNRKEAFQNSVHKTCSGDLLDKHAIYFTDKKQCFTPRILKTSHQPFLVKCRYYNPPSRKRSSSLGRPSLKSAGNNNKKKESLHRFLEDAHVRTHSAHFSQQPDENHEWWSHDSEMPLSPGLQLEELEEEYLCFLQDLTKDILIRSCYQKEALEDVFQMHIKCKRHNLDEVRGRWKTSDKCHPAVLPNISGQEHRTTQADECHSGVEAEKPFDSNTNEKNSSKPEERAGHHKPCRSFNELWGNTAGHQHSCNILLTCSGHFREHAKSLGTANYILHLLQCKPWVNRKVKKRSS